MPKPDDDIELLLQDLASPDVQDRVAVLKVLAEDPTGDARVAAALEPLLEDRSACVLTTPPSYGELRWLAAHALSRELERAGVPRRLLIAAVPLPVAASELARLAAGVGLPERLPALQCFETLGSAGVLPLTDLVLQARLAPA